MFSINLFQVLIRFLIGGSVVVASAVAARKIGGRVGGIFAAFPGVYLAAVVGLSMDYKGNDLLIASQQLSKGVFVGMVADIFCALAASYLILKYGWKQGLLLALLSWAVLTPIIYFFWVGL